MASISSRASSPAILSYGFRPFFLLAAVQAIFSVAIWIPWFLGIAAPRTGMPPVAWHLHSLLFGYLWAVVAGFLLTAVPNWTGRPPLRGAGLAVLVGLWIAGRFATFFASGLPQLLVVLLDLAMPIALTAFVGREIAVSNNRRNWKVVALIAALATTQAWFHWEIERFGTSDVSQRIAIGIAITLISVIGGRIIPAFTTNWLKSRQAGRMPAGFDGFDMVVMVATVAALGAWTAAAISSVPQLGLCVLLTGTGLLHWVRSMRWVPQRTFSEPLVAILHVAYLFVGAGFLLAGASALEIVHVPPSAAVHAWTVGAIGTMTLAVMTRATLGHTGQPLTAGTMTSVIYVAIVAAALLRIAVSLLPQHTLLLMPIAGLAWIAAFAAFLLRYGRLLCRPNEKTPS